MNIFGLFRFRSNENDATNSYFPNSFDLLINQEGKLHKPRSTPKAKNKRIKLSHLGPTFTFR